MSAKHSIRIERPPELYRRMGVLSSPGLDRAFAQYDFNREKVERMLEAHKSEIVVDRDLGEADLAL